MLLTLLIVGCTNDVEEKGKVVTVTKEIPVKQYQPFPTVLLKDACGIASLPKIKTNGDLLKYNKALELHAKKCNDRVLMIENWDKQQKALWNTK